VEGEVVARSEGEVVLRLGEEHEILRAERIASEENLGASLQDPANALKGLIRRGADQGLRNLDVIVLFVFQFGQALVLTLYKLVLILMITAFLVIDRDRILGFLRTVPPPRHRGTYEKLSTYIDRGLAGVVRGQLLICLVNGILTWVGLQFLGVRYSGLLGVIAGVFSLIPIFGTILSSIPIVLIAWGAGDFRVGLLSLGWILLIHFIEANYLNPRIMGSASKIHPVVVVFALLAGEHAYGLVGALLAVPCASIVQSSFKFYVLDRQGEAADDPEDDPIAAS
jgi:predicted PurR-regulated permease PerM